jgi:Protein of unknown function (DUF1566)
MKTVVKRSYLLAVALFVTMVNCHNDDEQVIVSVQNFTTTISENPVNGQSLGTVQATGSVTLAYNITSQTPTGALSINSSTGELTVANPALFDFETNPIISATVSVVGAVNTATVTINLMNVNEISVQNFATTISENPVSGQSLGTVQATGDGALTYSITAQTPTGALSINSSTGNLTVANNAVFNFETNPTLTATIAIDNSGTIKSLTATINLTNVNEVGEFKFGGVIFWVSDAGNQGLVCTTIDLNNGNSIRWNNGTNISTGATAGNIGTGQANTTAIISAQGTGTYAASLCDNLTLNGFSDWFLPSIDELAAIYTNRTVINSTAVANGGTSFSVANWSSSEQVGNVNNAFIILFVDGQTATLNSKFNLASVRAVRSWTDF